MRTQWCREHIDKTAKDCCLSQRTVQVIKQAMRFCELHPEFDKCGSEAILALIRIKDRDLKKRVVFEAKKHIAERPDTGGVERKNLTEKEVRWIIKNEEEKIRKEKDLPTPEEEDENVDKLLDLARTRLDEKMQSREVKESLNEEGAEPQIYTPAKASGEGFTPTSESASGVVYRPPSPEREEIKVMMTDSSGMSRRIHLTGGQVATINQMIKYNLAENEFVALQFIIDLGTPAALDKIEQKLKEVEA